MAKLNDIEETRTIEEYPAGVTISEGRTGDRTFYSVRTPRPAENGYLLLPTFETLDIAELYADVYFDVEGFRDEKTGERGIPPEVARAGTDTIAAYLRTQGKSTEFLMDWLGVKRETIHSYLSRVRSRAKEKRDELASD